MWRSAIGKDKRWMASRRVGGREESSHIERVGGGWGVGEGLGEGVKVPVGDCCGTGCGVAVSGLNGVGVMARCGKAFPNWLAWDGICPEHPAESSSASPRRNLVRRRWIRGYDGNGKLFFTGFSMCID